MDEMKPNDGVFSAHGSKIKKLNSDISSKSAVDNEEKPQRDSNCTVTSMSTF
jgi:hypothetical protein